MTNKRFENEDLQHPSLRALDPEARDPGYWNRFRHQVLALAGPELTRRRAVRPVTVSDVVMGWRNALVPTALLAAAVAGLLLLQNRPLTPPPASGLEELLVSGLEDPLPAIFANPLTNDRAGLSSEESF